MLSASPPERTGSRPPRQRPSTYERPENAVSLLLLPAEHEFVFDANGDAAVFRWPGNIFVFKSFINAWADVVVTNEVAARLFAARRWPKAGWQTCEATESMLALFRVEAERRKKEKKSCV